MRILQVVSSSRLAGTERHVLELAGGLRAAGIAVEAVCQVGGDGLDEAFETRDVPVHRMALSGGGMAMSLPRLSRLSLGFDLVHAHLTHATAAAVAARLIAGRPVVETRHFISLAHQNRRGIRRGLGQWQRAAINRGIELTIAPSRAVARHVPGEVVVVPHGIAIPPAVPPRTWSSRYITVGRLERDRNVDLAIEAFATAPSGATLTIVGDGSQRAQLERQVIQLGLAGRVLFTGRVPDVAPYLAASDAFLATATEAFGLAALEAMVAELPVIAVDSGGLAELVEDRRTGMCVKADAESFAKAIAELETNPLIACEYGAAGRHRAKGELTLERMVERTIDVYRQIARRSGNGPKVLRMYHSAVMPAWRERDRELRRGGADVTLVAAKAWHEGAGLVALDESDDFVVGVRTFGRHPALFFYDPLPIWRLMRRYRFDVIDAHEEPYSLAASEARLLAGRLQPGAAFVFYSAQNLMKRYPWPIRMIESRTLAASAAAYVCNQAAGEVLRRKGFIGQISPLPLGVDVVQFSPRQEGGGARFVVGYVGRLTQQKGVDVLIAALGGDSKWELLIAGDGPEKARLEGLARDLAVSATFLGTVAHDDLPALYRRLDVLVIPSRPAANVLEQFGRVAVEGMASGVAVVASHLGALPEVVGEAGILVPPDDADALRRALRRLANDSEERRYLGVLGRDRSRKFSWPAVAAAHRELYEKALCTSTS